MAVFATTDAALRARQVCEAMGMEIAPNNINNTRKSETDISPRTALSHPTYSNARLTVCRRPDLAAGRR
jgi:hypothetical protein